MGFDKNKFEEILTSIKPEKVLGVSGLAILSASSLFAFAFEPSQFFPIAAANYLTSIGLNVFASVLHGHYERLSNSNVLNTESIADLAQSLTVEIKRDARLRVEIGKYLQTIDAYAIAEEIAKANPQINSWLIYQIYNETSKYRYDFDSIHEKLAQVVKLIEEGQKSKSDIRSDSTKILFVDDDLWVFHSIIETLISRGFSVKTCANLKQAVEALQGEVKFDLVITDLLMPLEEELSGDVTYGGLAVVDFARLLFPTIPIIVFSVVTDSEIIDKLRQQNVSMLYKPTFGSELIHHVEIALIPKDEISTGSLVRREIEMHKLRLISPSPYERIKALWALGEIGHYSNSLIEFLRETSLSEANDEVKYAYKNTIEKIHEKQNQM